MAFSVIGYWGYTHDITIDDGVIHASLESKSYIIIELISVPLILYFLAAVFSIVFILKQYNRLANQNNYLLLIFSVLGFLTFFAVDRKRHNTLSSRLPYNVVAGIIDYTKKNQASYKQINKPIDIINTDINIVFILGESVRADHLGTNNYERNTTPLLNDIDDIISFNNLYTNRSYTAISIPQILSDEPMYPENNREYTSIIDVLNNAGVSTFWIGNQVPESSFRYFVDSTKDKVLIDPFRSIYSYNNASDLELLPYFKDYLKKPNQKFILLHMLGSHWMYEKRYNKEFSVFTPTAKSKYLPSNTRAEMINAYDNTILQLDYFINEVIVNIKEKNDKTMLIYVSDHGEALGENGKYLHAFSSPEIENPAGIIWFSPKLKQSNPEFFEQINSIKENNIELDFIFPTILDVLKAQNINYERNKSLLYTP